MSATGTRILPTRGFLLILKNRLKIIKEGYELLSMKREELVRYLQSLIKEIVGLRENVETLYLKAFRRFQSLFITLGPENIETYAYMMDDHIEISALTKSTMGVRYSEFKVEKLPDFRNKIPPIMLSIATDYQKFIKDLVKLAEIEAKIEAIARDLETTNKIVNSLENVVIPNLEKDVKYIEDVLEEEELEEFVRLKFARDIELKRRSK